MEQSSRVQDAKPGVPAQEQNTTERNNPRSLTTENNQYVIYKGTKKIKELLVWKAEGAETLYFDLLGNPVENDVIQQHDDLTWIQETTSNSKQLAKLLRDKKTHIMNNRFKPDTRYEVARSDLIQGAYYWRAESSDIVIYFDQHGKVVDNSAIPRAGWKKHGQLHGRQLLAKMQYLQKKNQFQNHLNDALSFVNGPLDFAARVKHGLMATGSNSPSVIRKMLLTIVLVALAPITLLSALVVGASKIAHKYKLENLFFNFVEHARTKLANWVAFVIFAVLCTINAIQQDKTVWTVLAAVVGVLAFFITARSESWPLYATITVNIQIVASVELLLIAVSASTSVHVIVSAIVLAIAGLLSYLNIIDLRLPYVIAWIILRYIRTTNGSSSAEAKWQLSISLLALLVLMQVVQQFTSRPPVGSTSHELFYRLTYNGETILSAATAVFVTVLWYSANVLPLGLPIVYLWGPIVFIVSHALAARGVRTNTSATFSLLRFLLTAFTLYLLFHGFSYKHAITSNISVEQDTCSPLLTNLHTCTGANDVYVYGTCCKKATFVVLPGIPSDGLARAAPDTCQRYIFSGQRDCCQKPRSARTDHLLGGPEACLCNNQGVPSADNAQCVCNAGYTGRACHMTS